MRLIAAVFFCALLHAQDFSEISGQVVDSATKQPLVGARVVLVRMNPGASYSTRTFDTELSPESPDPAAPIFAFMTDAQGLFRCRTTSPAEFMLFVSRPGYAKWGMSLETQRTISVKAGRTSNPVRVPLDAEGAISGRIVDADTGAPIPGLAVAAFRWRVFDGTRTLLQSGDSTTTNAAGAYEVTGLPPGDYHLQADTPTRGKFSPGGTPEDFRNHREIAYGRSYYPGVELREQSSSVTLLPGTTLASTDMKLTRRRLACIRGRLLSAEGESITGEVPVLLGRVEREGDSINLRSIAMAALPVGSSFRLDGLPPGALLARRLVTEGLAPGPPRGLYILPTGRPQC
ncbi:carboxypeptidase regulatory-like domain-containing protein [uncultured Paludibaculum sp.]|uniref:carboxypeptidase regulatory-like domain-containing protein n=1 Tax=uncultured Paludibaculum sp. TaxID=1765020 RepID=UPI002AAB5521|nr:carboxypeptidase regulatory-like domain-containing protein [uncultured Paludibaculum sp.]